MRNPLSRTRVAIMERPAQRPAVDHAAMLGALAVPVVLLDPQDRFRFANQAAEEYLGLSMHQLEQLGLSDMVAPDSPLIQIVRQVRLHGLTISDHDISIEGPRLRRGGVAIQVAPLSEEDGAVVLSFQDSSAARALDRQMSFRSAARSVTGMAAVLAHEVKNPLSGIRGAAQLLEASVAENDRELTVLIRDEADRIRDLVDRMEAFGEKPVERRGVNIHRVLEHVRRIAQSGFASHLRFSEAYDPSLPHAFVNRDMMIQVVLNLVKNAAEAITEGSPDGRGEITLATSFRHGMRLAMPGQAQRRELPLIVTVRDSGPGIGDDMMPHLFEPFVSGKPCGQRPRVLSLGREDRRRP